MKLKSHSGLKKRIKLRKSGKIAINAPGGRHLLSNKSKRQKKFSHKDVAVSGTIKQDLQRLTGGKVKRV